MFKVIFPVCKPKFPLSRKPKNKTAITERPKIETTAVALLQQRIYCSMRCEQEGNTAYTLSLYFEEQIVIECSVVKCDGSGNRWEVGGGGS